MKRFLDKVREPVEKVLVPVLEAMVFAYVVLSEMLVVSYGGRYVYLYIAQVLFIGIVCYMILERRFIAVRSVPAALIAVAMFFSFSSALREMELPYVQTAAVEWIQFIVLYFIAAFSEDRIRRSNRFLAGLRVAFRAALLLQCVFILLEFLADKFLEINLRNLIFFDFLKVELPDVLYDPEKAVTGLMFSQVLLPPSLVMGMMMFTNPLIRLLFIGAAFVARSSTSIVGVCLATVLLFIGALIEGKFKPSAVKKAWEKTALWKKIVYPLAAVVLILAGIFGGVFEKALSEVHYLLSRLAVPEKEMHIKYYLDFGKAFSGESFYQKVFGFGNGCSGFPMKALGYNYFEECMIVESDILDTLLSKGIFGFIACYSLPISVMVRGFKTDKRYVIFPLCLFVMAFGYNVQWHYTLFFLLILAACLAEKKDLFTAGAMRKKGPFNGGTAEKKGRRRA